jgi:hypothetical protein
MWKFITASKVQKKKGNGEACVGKKEKWTSTSGSLNTNSSTSNRAKPEGVSSSTFLHFGSLYMRSTIFAAIKNAKTDPV